MPAARNSSVTSHGITLYIAMILYHSSMPVTAVYNLKREAAAAAADDGGYTMLYYNIITILTE
jgi:hypothetical protein